MIPYTKRNERTTITQFTFEYSLHCDLGTYTHKDDDF